MGRPVLTASGAIPLNTWNDGMKRIIGLMVWLVIEGASPAMAWSVEPEKTGTLSFILENDLFYNVDNHYTTGVGFIWVPDRRTPTPAWAVKLAHLVPWVSEQSTFRHGYVRLRSEQAAYRQQPSPYSPEISSSPFLHQTLRK